MSLGDSLSRMSSRERSLVLLLVGIVLLMVIGGGVWWVRSNLAEREAKIAKNRAQWAKIQKLAGPYLEKKASYERTRQKLKENPNALSPETPVAETAVTHRVAYRTGLGGEDEKAPMNKILQSTGDLMQRPLLQKKKNQKGPQIYRVERQFQMRRGFARTEDVFDFLGKVESQDNLVFVTKLHMVRWSRDPDFLQIKNLTASTLRYEEDGEE